MSRSDFDEPMRNATDERLFVDWHNLTMRRLLRTAQQVAMSDAVILLVGERSTGKSALARQIHRWSRRHKRPFITVSGATLAKHLLQHGSNEHPNDTPRLASLRPAAPPDAEPGSTIFADDITELDTSLVMKLLDPVHTPHFQHVSKVRRPLIPWRIIAAVNLDAAPHLGLRQHIENFVYKLGVVVLKVPPLRERPEDLLPLAKTLLSNIRIEHHRHRLHFSPHATAEIMRYQWPGNFAELRETIETGAMSAYKGLVTLKELPNTRRSWVDPSEALARAASLKDVERDYIVRILSQSRSLMDAARTLGIDIATLWRKRKRYKIDYCCP